MINDVVIIFAAHPDDEVLGCGGTIAKFVKKGASVHLRFIADGESSRFQEKDLALGLVQDSIESRVEAGLNSAQILGCQSVEFYNFPDNRLDGVELLQLIKVIEKDINSIGPNIIFTHHCGDLNIDHRIVSEAVLVATRPVLRRRTVRELYFFEVPSSTEWSFGLVGEIFRPNVFVDITDSYEVKIRALRPYQREILDYPHPRSLAGIEALCKMRGVTGGFNYAEAFVLARKLI